MYIIFYVIVLFHDFAAIELANTQSRAMHTYFSTKKDTRKIN